MDTDIEKNEKSTNITLQIREQFESLTSDDYYNFALFSCFVNGEPAAAIVVVNRDGEEFTIQPMFVSVTPGMVLTDHEGKEPKWEERDGS